MRMKITVGFNTHADHHENLSFIVRVTYKEVLCCFVIFSSLVMYVEYFKTLKNVLSGGR